MYNGATEIKYMPSEEYIQVYFKTMEGIEEEFLEV